MGHIPRHNGSPARAGKHAEADTPITVEHCYRLRFTTDALDPANPTLRAVIHPPEEEAAAVLVCVDSGVIEAWPDLPERLEQYFNASRAGPGNLRTETTPICAVLTVPGGEDCKNDSAHAEAVVRAIHDHGICRHSYVLAIGGGAVLDAVGYAAAIAHRGVRTIRMPTTTLGQGDAGIGVKNGINAFGKKNFLGTFAVPWAVINDDVFLRTLSDRDWRCGLSEAVKVALVKDRAFFEEIERAAPRLAKRDAAAARPIIRRCAELHLDHIATGGDPFELTAARPLDFGHWSAHKLEQMTDFRLRHGEAVAIGLAIDTIYSSLAHDLSDDETERVLHCLEVLGFELFDRAALEYPTLLEGLDEFREHLGGRLTVAMLGRIGEQVDVHEVDTARLRDAIDRLGDRAGMAAQHGRM